MSQQDKQKQLLIEMMQADEKNGLYEHISKMETTQTAVEWLSERYMYVTWLRNRDEISPEVADNLRSRYLEQAKQMEKEQIKKAYKDYHNLGHIYGLDTEQYYNETYEKQSHL